MYFFSPAQYMDSTGEDPIWYDNPKVLAARWSTFFPSPSMSLAERANAYVRLILYVTAALYLYRRDSRYIVFGVGLVVLVTALYMTPTTSIGRSSSRTVERLTASSPQPASASRKPCRKSTPENPFANHLLTDDPLAPPACPYDEHAELIRENFNKGLFRNVEDIWERQNSQRQFYTMPNTEKIPDTKAFAEFLSGNLTTRKTCKEDTTVCTGTRA